MDRKQLAFGLTSLFLGLGCFILFAAAKNAKLLGGVTDPSAIASLVAALVLTPIGGILTAYAFPKDSSS